MRRSPVPTLLYRTALVVVAAGSIALLRAVFWARETGVAAAAPWDCVAFIVGGAAGVCVLAAFLVAAGRAVELAEWRAAEPRCGAGCCRCGGSEGP